MTDTLMDQFVELIEYDEELEEKHLPGQHEQQRHAGTLGSIGESVEYGPINEVLTSDDLDDLRQQFDDAADLLAKELRRDNESKMAMDGLKSLDIIEAILSIASVQSEHLKYATKAFTLRDADNRLEAVALTYPKDVAKKSGAHYLAFLTVAPKNNAYVRRLGGLGLKGDAQAGRKIGEQIAKYFSDRGIGLEFYPANYTVSRVYTRIGAEPLPVSGMYWSPTAMRQFLVESEKLEKSDVFDVFEAFAKHLSVAWKSIPTEAQK